MMDSDIVEGWDKNGVHCWSMHMFDSIEFVESNSERICLVDRKFNDGRIENFEFRKYLNKFGDERFVMFSSEDGMSSRFERRKLCINITDGNFFRKFCDELLEFGEISEKSHDILVESIIPSEAAELDVL